MGALLALFGLAGCAAPKDSYVHFRKPKYKVRPKARNSTPGVAQTWWSHRWFWQRHHRRIRIGKTP